MIRCLSRRDHETFRPQVAASVCLFAKSKRNGARSGIDCAPVAVSARDSNRWNLRSAWLEYDPGTRIEPLRIRSSSMSCDRTVRPTGTFHHSMGRTPRHLPGSIHSLLARTFRMIEAPAPIRRHPNGPAPQPSELRLGCNTLSRCVNWVRCSVVTEIASFRGFFPRVDRNKPRP
jgi:hypothetical protein